MFVLVFICISVPLFLFDYDYLKYLHMLTINKLTAVKLKNENACREVTLENNRKWIINFFLFFQPQIYVRTKCQYQKSCWNQLTLFTIKRWYFRWYLSLYYGRGCKSMYLKHGLSENLRFYSKKLSMFILLHIRLNTFG